MDSAENVVLENISLVDLIQDSNSKNMCMGKRKNVDIQDGEEVDE